MIDLEKVLKLWEADAKIDELNLDKSSIHAASIHSKYVDILSKAKMEKREAEMIFTELKRDKWLWFNGKMSREEVSRRGWNPDPFNGLTKPLRSEMDIFFDADPDIMKQKARVDYASIVVEALEEIISTIRWRHSVIKNIIDAKKFYAGT